MSLVIHNCNVKFDLTSSQSKTFVKDLSHNQSILTLSFQATFNLAYFHLLFKEVMEGCDPAPTYGYILKMTGRHSNLDQKHTKMSPWKAYRP